MTSGSICLTIGLALVLASPALASVPRESAGLPAVVATGDSTDGELLALASKSSARTNASSQVSGHRQSTRGRNN